MNFLKTISNLLLATLILLTASGVTIHKHHCMGMVRDVAINQEADPCTGNMDMETSSGCCSNSMEYFQTDDFNVSATHFDPDTRDSVIDQAHHQWIEKFKRNLPSYNTHTYKPPLPDRDIPVLIQSFLI